MARASTSTEVADRLESKAIAPRAKGDTIFDLIKRQQPAIEAALPNTGITPERLSRIVMTQLRMNEKLASCTPQSLLGAMMLTAQLGLEPGPLGQAYFVPYGKEVTFIVGYKGLVQLAWRAGITISAYEICRNDLFKHDYGTGKVEHTFHLSRDRGEIIGVWAKAVLPNGQQSILVMTKAEVDAHKKRSRASDSGPWFTDYVAMAKKTAIRVLCSQVPLSAEGQRAIAADETTVNFSEAETVIEYVETAETVTDTSQAEVEVERA